MYLAPDGDELEIAQAAAGFLAEAMSIERLHGAACADMSADLRHSLGSMGWFALALPGHAGGSGLSAVEHALFFREVGRQCGPVDVLAQCLAATIVDDNALRSSIVSGDVGVALAVGDGTGLRIFGSENAAFMLQLGRDRSDLYTFKNSASEPRASLDPATSIRVSDRVPTVASSETGDRAWNLGQLGTAAMLVGIAEASLDQIVDYAKVRETFGKKIGSWQAVRHPCADMAVRLEAARAQLWFAATAMKEGRGDAGVHLDAAKYLANQAALANADTNIQLHGGIGVTDEHHAHLYLKHALVLARLFGGRREVLGRLLHAEVED
ncbi:acyl-CoA dehydrogenase family protein [Sphingomonas sp. SUN039]|uniref:acyl-CoA dehydrogenase family protein n=1 Tax=Sphingomonas sp. SUN039 TaxID=2937787 RepID=UPI0021642393|nr:acyl-CoA dehydrogenase family protein [Sphingomonas sp. SUN039]UVO53664.1 acyl-CoA dehydrogenase family protein [Sphingomonas sp. SUN039]